MHDNVRHATHKAISLAHSYMVTMHACSAQATAYPDKLEQSGCYKPLGYQPSTYYLQWLDVSAALRQES